MTTFASTLEKVEGKNAVEVFVRRETLYKLMEEATERPRFSDNGLLILKNETEGIYFHIRVNVTETERYLLILAEKREKDTYKVAYKAKATPRMEV